MKKTLVLLGLILVALNLKAQDPLLKIYQADGSFKTYKLNDIENLSLTNSNDYTFLKIYSKQNQMLSEVISKIDSIKFEENQANPLNLILYIKDKSSKSFLLADIDSLITKIDNQSVDNINDFVIKCQNGKIHNIEYMQSGENFRILV